MKATIKKEDDERLEFTLKDATVSFANMIRRIGMGQIPIFAIQSITVYENRTSMFDEYIAHRIGLIPISTPAKYTAEDEVLFTLDAQGPCTVYSKDLKSFDDKVKVSNPNIPIIRLGEGQNLRIEGKARLGTGRQHARHQPGLISYSYDDKGNFEFKVESFSQISPREIITRACGIAETKCEEFLEAIEEEKEKKEE